MSDLPQLGHVYQYDGGHYTVSRVEPGMFVTRDGDAWVDAIEMLDTLATRRAMVMTLAEFQALETAGEITLPPPPEPPPAPPDELTPLPAKAPAKSSKKESKK